MLFYNVDFILVLLDEEEPFLKA